MGLSDLRIRASITAIAFCGLNNKIHIISASQKLYFPRLSRKSEGYGNILDVMS
jgi:hypothetical protein